MTNRIASPRPVLFGAILFALVLGVAGSAHAAKVKLAWDPVTTKEDGTPLQPGELGGYKIYYGTITALYNGTEADQGPSPVTFPLNTIADPQNPLVELTGLATCQHYFFAVTAYDNNNNESGYSNEAAGTIVDKPVLAPLQVVGENEVRVTWSGLGANDQGFPTGYLVYYDTDSGAPYSGAGSTQGPSPVSVAANLTTLRLTGLIAGTTYYVMVESTCSDGTKAASAEASGTTNYPSTPQPDQGVPPPQPDMGVPPSQSDVGVPEPDAFYIPPARDSGYTPPSSDQGSYTPPPRGDAYVPPSYSDSGVTGWPSESTTLKGGCSVGGAPSSLPLLFLVLLFVLRRGRG